MRIDPGLDGTRDSGPPTSTAERPDATRLIAELEGAGLVSVEIDDDGDISFVLTRRGRRTATLMAMSRQSHALVLLGALVGIEDGPN